VPDDQSYFSKALLSCLEGDGAEEVAPGQWGVTAASLARGLEHHMKLIESKYKRHQRVQFTNATSVAVLRHFGGIPQMSFDVEVVPQQLAPHVEIHVSDSNLSEEGRFGPPLEPHPFPVCLAIGPYLVKTKRTGQTPDADPVGRLMTVSCPPQPWLLRV